ncbi:hypothetical protein TPHA_0G00230 [Tetrapisispora phaffii CBS 4417]|uniref:DNA-directed RNA polymerase III subunit RPC3 n=1 Tax=Tetrapisispora phaffii (strain ATCC 24235 / CBS 4417 / NBRC 1672 / NRRL Y-8282 / UCD 70-5) TaxID=1071381 RepID=G8BVD3_TETPH|nr:hypothetical protein TPHA_0G00230 [Tetrapisispora phaffii CBS 4417]CCE63861.1 hypothetical protein TPHA_0G00230 [Tetrapisispora phaffii CBS 4417]
MSTASVVDATGAAAPVAGEETDLKVTFTDEVNDLTGVASLEQRSLNSKSFLYSEVTKSHLGENAELVIRVLVSKGRLTIHEIHRYISGVLENGMNKFAGINKGKIKKILISLVQLRCVSFFVENSLNKKASTYYSVNYDGLDILLYNGLILEEVSNRFNSDLATRVVQNILSVGSLTIEEYLHSGDFKSEGIEFNVKQAFLQLFEQGFLVPMSMVLHTPINDLWNKIYAEEYKKIPRTSTLSELKKKTEAKEKAKVKFLFYFDDLNNISKNTMIDPQTSMKILKQNIPLTINFDRFLKTRRTKQLVHFARSRVGDIPAFIYKLALQSTERNSLPVTNPFVKTGLLQDLDDANIIREEDRVNEESKKVTFTAADITRCLPHGLDLKGSLTSKVKSNKRMNNESENNVPKKLKTEDGFVIPSTPSVLSLSEKSNESIDTHTQGEESTILDDVDIDVNFDEQADPITLVNGHLKLLSQSNIPFLREAKPGVFFVPFTELLPVLRSSTYDNIITSTLGPSSTRVRRCVIANRLTSEKVINSTALMKEKDIRSTIASVLKYNVLEIQEVPRTADRGASRAVFLFRSKERHSYDFMRENISWNMANLMYKEDKLKADNITLLTKANRDDVKGKEGELLLPSEMSQLKMVNERELNIKTRICRLLSLWEVYKF